MVEKIRYIPKCGVEKEARVVTGTVGWFSDETGEGYIISDDGGEKLFVCLTGVAPGQGGALEVLRRGARVSCEVVGGLPVSQAKNVRRLGRAAGHS